MLLIIAGVIVDIMFAPFSMLFNIIRVELYRQQLPAAKARWEQAGLLNYQVDVHGRGTWSYYDGRLISREGRLVEIQPLQLAPPRRSPHSCGQPEGACG
jgi:hypothetical protein